MSTFFKCVGFWLSFMLCTGGLYESIRLFLSSITLSSSSGSVFFAWCQLYVGATIFIFGLIFTVGSILVPFSNDAEVAEMKKDVYFLIITFVLGVFLLWSGWSIITDALKSAGVLE